MKISNCSGSLPGCRDSQVYREWVLKVPSNIDLIVFLLVQYCILVLQYVNLNH